MKLNQTLRVLNYRIQFYISFYKTSNKRTIGIYDICSDSKHVLFLDYDKFRLDWLENELRWLQKTFILSDFIILESSEGSYHAVCFDKFDLYQHHKIIQTTNVDEAFRNAPRWDYGSRVLRVLPKGKTRKPKYITTIYSKHNLRLKSNAHLKFFKHHYDIPFLNNENNDGLGKVYLIDYPTKKNIKGEK